MVCLYTVVKIRGQEMARVTISSMPADSWQHAA